MVRCFDCGLLTYLNEEGFHELYLGDRYLGIAFIPKCFAHVVNFDEEYRLSTKSNDLAKFSEAINKERPCAISDTKYGFTPHYQGFSPKEHLEMIDRERQFRMEQEQREWIAEQRRLDIEWRERQERINKNNHRWDLIILGIVATLIVSAATIITAFISRGWIGAS